jgi:hypothetical protein
MGRLDRDFKARLLLKPNRMRLLFAIFLLLASAGLGRSSALPLTAKEVALMLRSGYSSDAVLRELSTRRFADTFSPEIEQQVTHAGATPALLQALRSGAYQLSAAEIDVYGHKRGVQEKRGIDASAPVNEPEQSKKNAPPLVKSTPRAPTVNEVYRLLQGDLVSCHQGAFAPFDDEELQSKTLFVFFFSANWAQAGRKFTPRLIEYYQRTVPQHPELEVIFFSADRSPFGMETYMNQSHMPWPAVDFSKVGEKAARMDKTVMREIPALIVVERGGRILSQSSGEPNGGDLDKVLNDLDQIMSPGHVARSP